MTSTERPTRQRRAIATALARTDEFQSAQQIHDALRREGDAIGLSTVYRNLQALAEAGDVDVLRNESGEALYRRCSESHHHHLVCRECGATVEVEGPTVERWARAVAAEHGYVDVDHTLELVGLCADCARSPVDE